MAKITNSKKTTRKGHRETQILPTPQRLLEESGRSLPSRFLLVCVELVKQHEIRYDTTDDLKFQPIQSPALIYGVIPA